MLEIQALADAPQFDVEVALNLFKRDFLAGVVQRKVNFAKSADPDSAFDRISLKIILWN